MKRMIVLVLALACLTVAGVGQAGAHTTSYPTSIGSMHFEGYPGNALLSGLVTSEKPGCVSGRKVKLIIDRPGEGRIVLDTARTSSAGAYGLHGAFNGNDIASVKVAKEKIGRRHHKHICATETVVVYAPPV